MDLRQFSSFFNSVKRDSSFFTLGNLGSSPTSLSLCFAENETFLKKICDNEIITCVLCTPELADNDELLKSGKGIAVCESPRRSFYKLHNWLSENSDEYNPKKKRTVIGEDTLIHPSAVIADMGVIIGNNVTIEEEVIIRSGTIIDDDTIIFAGAIIGGENHIITNDKEGNLFLIKQMGKCHIGKNVAIGYHSMIARGTFPYDETVIGDYTKIENSVEVSHNSKIGRNCIITGQCQICGNAVIGDNCRMNPKSVVSNQVKIGDDVMIGIGSVVVNNLKNGSNVSGNYAIDHRKFLLWHRKKLAEK